LPLTNLLLARSRQEDSSLLLFFRVSPSKIRLQKEIPLFPQTSPKRRAQKKFFFLFPASFSRSPLFLLNDLSILPPKPDLEASLGSYFFPLRELLVPPPSPLNFFCHFSSHPRWVGILEQLLFSFPSSLLMLFLSLSPRSRIYKSLFLFFEVLFNGIFPSFSWRRPIS